MNINLVRSYRKQLLCAARCRLTIHVSIMLYTVHVQRWPYWEFNLESQPPRDAALCNRFARYLEVTKCLGQEQTGHEPCDQHKLGSNVNFAANQMVPKITSLIQRTIQFLNVSYRVEKNALCGCYVFPPVNVCNVGKIFFILEIGDNYRSFQSIPNYSHVVLPEVIYGFFHKQFHRCC
jgi:hypothetical protein